MKKAIIIVFCLFSFQVFSQFKSNYFKKDIQEDREKEKKEDNKRLYESYFFSALKAKSLENYNEALRNFQSCIKVNKKEPAAFYESALINKNKEHLDLAEEQIKTAIRLEKNNRWYQLAYAEILFKKQNFKGAAEVYNKLKHVEPGNEELYYLLADTYIYDNEFLQAISVYNDLEESKGVDKMISMQKYKLYMQIQKIKPAIEELLRLIEKNPSDIETLEILSEAYLLNDEKTKAFDIFKKIGIIDPKNGRIHLTLADYYRENGDNNQSFEELKLAFKSSNLKVHTKVQILASYFQILSLNDTMIKQANELSKILIETHKENPKAHAIYADILYAQNKFQEAKEHYLIVLEKDKTKIQAWTQVLFIQAEQQDFSGMLEVSTEALTYFPIDPLFYYFNGMSNKWFKKNEAAISSLELGVEFVVDNEMLLLEFYSSLADLHHTAGNHKKSDEFYEKVLEIDSENLLVLNNYAYYLSVRKVKLEKAKKMSWKCNNLEEGNATYQDTYSWILYQLSNYEAAKEWIKKALLNGGNTSAVIVEHYGDILYKLGDKEGAFFQWKTAKDLGEGSKFLIQKIKEGRLYE